MIRYNVFVLWSDGTWSVFSVECDDIYKFMYKYRMDNLGKIFKFFHEEWRL